MKEKYSFFGPATLIYAVIYVFCTFRNPSGITYPIFIASSLVYMCLALAKLEVTLKKRSLFYAVSMMLLGVSTFCTDDERIIMMNKTGIFVLMLVFLLQQFCDTSGWHLGKYLSSLFGMMFVSLGEIGRPFGDSIAYCREKNKILSKRMVSVIIGIAAAIPLLAVIVFLLASADAVFENILDELLEGISLGNGFADGVNIVIRIVVFFVLVYALLSYLSSDKMPKEQKSTRNGEPVIAITVTGLLSAVYVLFSGIQILYLFLGKMTLPEGYTYAGYARQGFFQLLAVSVINLIIVLISLECFKESKALKIILTIMSFCTFIMILSSAVRMIMYIRYYFLTFQRVFVLWTLLVLFILFIGVMINIRKDNFPLFRYSLATVVVLYLILSFSHPDYYIAKINLANAPHKDMEEWEPQEGDFFQSGDPYSDYHYLKSMSADAAPALIPYMVEWGVPVEVFYSDDIFENFPSKAPSGIVNEYHYYLLYLDNMKQKVENAGWREFNISRHMMLRCIEKYSE